ncbi:MAG: hypothetical protein AAB532_03220 [Patescibacteria group bacterium]
MKNQSGQALLIIVLVMVIGLTVTLAVVSRSIVNLKTSVEQTDSQKALAAAEAGVEQTIINNVSIGSDSNYINIGNGASYKTNITQVAGNASFLVNGGNIVSKNEGAFIWLSDYNNSGSWTPGWSGDLIIYFGDPAKTDANNPAIEIVLISGANVATAQTKRFAFDPYSTRANSNNFTKYPSSTVGAIFQKVTTTVSGKQFAYRIILNNILNGLVVRTNPIYQSSYIAAGRPATDPSLPAQGQVIIAEAKSGSVRRKVTVFQGYPELPAELFPYSILVPR